MKPDDFERKLERQPVRRVPAGWRAEILRTAETAASRDEAELVPHQKAWWRELLWPCPQAWAGLAALWMVIWFLNVASREPGQGARTAGTPPAREALMALKERRRMLAELACPPEPAEPPKPFVPRPRSELSPVNVAV